MSKTKIEGEIVKRYLESFPKAGAHTLARKIHIENPLVFKDSEQVRSIIRHYIGQRGAALRNRLLRKGDTKFMRAAGDPNPYRIPESDCDPWEPIHIPERLDSGLVFSDLHFPYHDVQAFNSMIEHTLQHKKINFIIINGDGMDCYQLSRFCKDPRKMPIDDELWGWIEFINTLYNIFPGVKIYWKLGNHEERLEKYLYTRAPELVGMNEFKMSNILKIRGLQDIEVIEHQIIYAGRLPFVHGHEFAGSANSPVNPARGLFLKTLSSAAVSHHHRSSAHSETDINEKLMSWYSLGCMCGLHPEFALINKWNHGFSYIATQGKEFEFENMKIYKGVVYS